MAGEGGGEGGSEGGAGEAGSEGGGGGAKAVVMVFSQESPLCIQHSRACTTYVLFSQCGTSGVS